MVDYREIKCPKCGGIIEHDETYESYASSDYFVNLCAGHCAKCESTYEWEEKFIMKFDSIANFEEVS